MVCLTSSFLPAVVVLLCGWTVYVQSNEGTVSYGIDISYPMHAESVSVNYAWLPWNVDPSIPTPDKYKGMPVQPLGDKQSLYDSVVEGCYEHYGRKGWKCRSTEISRIERNIRQPAGVYNYTKLGYAKMRAPEDLFRRIQHMWEKNKDQGKEIEEVWDVGSTFTNHWDVPCYMLGVEWETLEGGGPKLRQDIWDAVRVIISEWTGQHLSETSLYGIRIYKEGAILAPHVDRFPLVSSAILNVDQDVDEPWPLEVIGHDGVAVNITMEPGDLVLYESHSIIHGRQFPLKGRFMANIFIHFEPLGPIDEEIEIDPDLPSYIIRGSEAEEHWRVENPFGYKVEKMSGMHESTGPAGKKADRIPPRRSVSKEL